MKQAVAFMLTVASGQADALSGCYVGVDDDLAVLVAQAEAIQHEARLTLRLARLALPMIPCISQRRVRRDRTARTR